MTLLPQRRWLRYVLATLVIVAIGYLVAPKRLTIIVSNQSSELDSIDMQIEVDGQTVVKDDFISGTGHNYCEFEVSLWPGRHSICAKSLKGEAIAKSQFYVFWNRWAIIDYWYRTDRPGAAYRKTPKHISIRMLSLPPVFR